MFCSIYLLLSIEYLNMNFCTAVACYEVLKLGTLLSVFKIQFSIVGVDYFCRSLDGSVGSLCLLIVSCVCLFWC
jgi:hypothetical protein